MCGCGMHGDSGGERHRTLRHERGGCGGKSGHAWYESSATEPVVAQQAPAAPRARKAQPALGKERSRRPLHHLSSCMRPPPARSEDGACGEAAMLAGLVTGDSNCGGKVWWPDIANTAPAGWLGVIMYHVPVMWRWVCAAVDQENPRRVVNVGGEYWRTRSRNRCVIGSCEVPPRYHGVVAAAHTGTSVRVAAKGLRTTRRSCHPE